MISKLEKLDILKKYQIKEDRFFVSNILDKIDVCEYEENICTNFLEQKYLDIAIKLLNKFKINYYIFSPNNSCEKKIIILELNDIKKICEDITCIKIIPNVNSKLLHKDYMGAIYSLGLKREMIGDIFALDNCAYVFLLKQCEDYILNNLLTVSKYSVSLEILSLESNEVKSLSTNLVETTVIVPSLRVDAVLSAVYNISRSKIKEKINGKDLFVNTKEITSCDFMLEYDNIVSLKRCGKIKIGQIEKKTKSGNFILSIFKYS